MHNNERICKDTFWFLSFSSGDPLSNVEVDFFTKEDAIAFCDRNGKPSLYNILVVDLLFSSA